MEIHPYGVITYQRVPVLELENLMQWDNERVTFTA